MRLRTTALLLLALAGLGVALERLIVTDAEAVEAVVARAVDAVNARDLEALAGTLDDAYAEGGRDRDAVVAYVGRLLLLYAPGSVDADVEDVVVRGDEATARARIRAWVAARPWLLQVALDLVRRPDGWRIRAARPEGLGS